MHEERTNTVTLPTLQPPATPVNATMTGNLPSVTITTSLGVVLCSNSATPFTTASAALVAAGHDPSTYIKILGQSGNPFWWGQLIDMINTAAHFGD
jgi:hypothetical protein